MNFGMRCGHMLNCKAMFKKGGWLAPFVFCGLVVTLAVRAEEMTKPDAFLPSDAVRTNWLFSGMVMNESGERYGYYFSLRRERDQLYARAALVDGKTQRVVLLEDGHETWTNPLPYHWQVGSLFLRFNPVNDSWIFGVKTKDKKGFNFKVDMLEQPDHTPSKQDLGSGMALVINQTSRLNGHLLVNDDDKEQFVTATNAWFRQVWEIAPKDNGHPLDGVFCRFNDGSGFYSVSAFAADAVRDAMAGWRDANGASALISQFIQTKEKGQGIWHIRLGAPNLHLVLSDALSNEPTKPSGVTVGFINHATKPGFCMIEHG